MHLLKNELNLWSTEIKKYVWHLNNEANNYEGKIIIQLHAIS